MSGVRVAARLWGKTNDPLAQLESYRSVIRAKLARRIARDLVGFWPELVKESDRSEGRTEFILDVVVLTPEEYERLKNAGDKHD